MAKDKPLPKAISRKSFVVVLVKVPFRRGEPSYIISSSSGFPSNNEFNSLFVFPPMATDSMAVTLWILLTANAGRYLGGGTMNFSEKLSAAEFGKGKASLTNRDTSDGASVEQQSPGLFQQIMEHTKTTWKHVGQGKASASECLEAGMEIVAASVAGRYGMTRLGGTADGLLFKSIEDVDASVPREQTMAAGETSLRPTILSSSVLRDEAVDRLAPVLTRRTLRYTIDQHYPREQF
jgi:hypothetical protein